MADRVQVSPDSGPLLSAVLIVRDEAATLPGCLASLAGVVDEIHVHDTGSTDRTPEIAARLGALVTHGPWTDDFATARNQATNAAHAANAPQAAQAAQATNAAQAANAADNGPADGSQAYGTADSGPAGTANGTPSGTADSGRDRWVLAIDADERYRGDPAELRALLADYSADLAGADPTQVDPVRSDLIRVEIDNAHDGIPYTHVVGRLYRPDVLHWQGRVHEQLVTTDGTPPPARLAPRTAITLDHQGYARSDVRTTKADRNAALARRTLDELAAAGPRADPQLLATTLLDLGRSLVGAGRRQAAVNTFETLRELAPGTPEWLHGTDFLARLVLAAGMDDVCLVLVEQMREAGAATPYCDWLAAQALAQLGDVRAADELLTGLTEVVDTAGRRYDPAVLHELQHLVTRLRQPA